MAATFEPMLSGLAEIRATIETLEQQIAVYHEGEAEKDMAFFHHRTLFFRALGIVKRAQHIHQITGQQIESAAREMRRQQIMRGRIPHPQTGPASQRISDYADPEPLEDQGAMPQESRPITPDEAALFRQLAERSLEHRDAMPDDTPLRRFFRERLQSDAEVWSAAADRPTTWEAMEAAMFERENEIRSRYDVTP